MIIDIVLLGVALLVLVIGSYTDIKTREVPDWLNFSMIAAGIGLRGIYSLATFDWSFLLQGVIGLGIFVAVGYLMFYAGQWGGGDSKMLMGMGAVLGFDFNLDSLLIVFIINILFAGALYGLLWGIVSAVIKRRSFVREFKKIMNSRTVSIIRKIYLVCIAISFIFVIFFIDDLLIKWLSVGMLFIFYISFYAVIFIKSVENACMLKWVRPSVLTEGDWIAKEVKVKGKKIVGPKDLGISKEQIKKLKDIKVKKVLVKYGIPFVPSFLLAFVISLIWGAWWVYLF
ncbi:hypothetical protein GF336_06170 [Candidatus Woesearchaeota archaeon]|nr:hypothetical protein [Candidatus Woesearchaeota archaeon]